MSPLLESILPAVRDPLCSTLDASCLGRLLFVCKTTRDAATAFLCREVTRLDNELGNIQKTPKPPAASYVMLKFIADVATRAPKLAPHVEHRFDPLYFNPLNGGLIRNDGARAIAFALKGNCTLRRLELQSSCISASGVKALALAIKTSPAALEDLALLYNRDMGVEGAKALVPLLGGDSALRKLNIYRTAIGDEGAKVIAIALESNTSLLEINLGANAIGPEGAVVLAAALRENTTLLTLKVGSNAIGDDGFKAIAEALGANSALHALDLCSNGVGTVGIDALAAALGTNSTLRKLRLGGADQICPYSAHVLAKALSAGSALQELDLACSAHGVTGLGGYHGLGDDGANEFGAVLAAHPSLLRVLRLGRNNIGVEGARALAAMLGVGSLRSLDLSSNHDIGDEGAAALAAALVANPTSLLELNLNYIRSGPAAATALATALGTNSALEKLSLNCTEVRDEGAKALAAALCANSGLQELALRDTFIGPPGAVALAQALASNTTLRELNISNSRDVWEGAACSNHVYDAGAVAFAQALANNSTLLKLNISGAGVGTRGCAALESALDTNTTLEFVAVMAPLKDKPRTGGVTPYPRFS